MKTNAITVCVYGNPNAVCALTGHYTSDIELKQIATYAVENGFAVITQLVPLIKTEIKVALPLHVPVRDLGSGHLRSVDFNANTNTADESICPTTEWADRRSGSNWPTPVPEQIQQADFLAIA